MRGGYFGTRPFGVPGWHRWCSRAPSGRVAVCVRGRRPARSPSALRAFGAARRLEARPGPAAAHGHRGHALRTGGAVSLCVVARPCRRPWTPRLCPPHRRRCVVVCGGQALPPPTDTAAMPPGSPAPSALRTHVVSCVADPGGKITIRTVGIVLREVSDKASPGPLRALWSRGGYESMSGCDRASQAHTEAPGAVAPGALAAIRCEPSEPNATRSVAA